MKNIPKGVPVCHVCGKTTYHALITAGYKELAEELIASGEYATDLIECEQCGGLVCEEDESCAEILNEDQTHCKTCLSKQTKCDCTKCIANPKDCPEAVQDIVDGEEVWTSMYSFYYGCPEYIGSKD